MRSMTYFCVVEGQQEKMYLNHLARLLTDFPKKVIKFNCVIDNASRLKTEYVEYDKVFLFDHDLDPIRFERNLDTCVSLNRDAGAKRFKRNGTPHIYHAYSNICFDLWLLLHKQNYFRAETATDAYVDHVRSAFNLERNADIKREDVIEHILKQINLDDVKLAISTTPTRTSPFIRLLQR